MGDNPTTDPTPDDETPDEAQDAPPPPPDDALGDAGRKALKAERDARKAAETRARELERKVAEFEQAQMTETERAAARARDAEERAQRIEAKTRSTVLRAHAVALGAVDVDAVLALVDTSGIEVTDDGEVVGAEEAVKALLDAKPYLAKPSTPPPLGSADGGAQGNPAGRQLTRDDLDRLTREGKHDEIVRAKAEGRLNKLLGIG